MGIGDWGLGVGGWGFGGGGVGFWDLAHSPNPQSPIPNPHFNSFLNDANNKKLKINKLLFYIYIKSSI